MLRLPSSSLMETSFLVSCSRSLRYPDLFLGVLVRMAGPTSKTCIGGLYYSFIEMFDGPVLVMMMMMIGMMIVCVCVGNSNEKY